MARAKKKKHQRIKILSIFLGLIICMGVICAFGAGILGATNAGVIPPGLIIKGNNLANLTIEEGRAQLAAIEEELRQKIVTIDYQGVKHNLTLASLGLTIDADATIDQAAEEFSQLGFLKRSLARLLPNKQNRPAVLVLNRDQTKAELQNIINPLYYPAINASLTLNEAQQIEITPSQTGRQVEIDQLTSQLTELINNDGDLNIDLPVSILQPQISEEEAAGWNVNGVIAQYTTIFNPYLYSRVNNIKAAAAAFNNLLLSPDQVISFNDIVGPRNAARGYQKAGVIVGNKFEEDFGGGICQVSTTLYNAILLAGMDAVARGSHNLPITYAPIGLDAAVDYGTLDFAFKNTTGRYAFMTTTVQTNQITVKIYGNLAEKKNIKLNSWITATIAPKEKHTVDTSLEPGTTKVVQNGSSGYQAIAQRLILDADGQVISEETLSSSYYLPVEKIIASGEAIADIASPLQTADENLGYEETVRNIASSDIAQPHSQDPIELSTPLPTTSAEDLDPNSYTVTD